MAQNRPNRTHEIELNEHGEYDIHQSFLFGVAKIHGCIATVPDKETADQIVRLIETGNNKERD